MKRKVKEWIVHELLLNRLLGVIDIKKYGPLIRVREVILTKKKK